MYDWDYDEAIYYMHSVDNEFMTFPVMLQKVTKYMEFELNSVEYKQLRQIIYEFWFDV